MLICLNKLFLGLLILLLINQLIVKIVKIVKIIMDFKEKVTD